MDRRQLDLLKIAPKNKVRNQVKGSQHKNITGGNVLITSSQARPWDLGCVYRIHEGFIEQLGIYVFPRRAKGCNKVRVKKH